ncbi:hypothetical protein [Halopiger djelfimassiliensis]|uniref:hypothetical protein n=1 Tax=Halopiger djelfimassiliensis TaxID=1293047 RepID=UPI000677A871|nr:hypothetical protein [Halopiger djelfimassiliensis]
MSDAPDPAGNESPNSSESSDESSVPECPRCGTPVATVSVIGPIDAVAGPCGCRVAPGSVMNRDDGDRE